jgi:ABC-type antimicrobial peptide transport system ATPase subunit
MQDLRRDRGLSYLFISHDLSVIRYMADTIGVMYLGKLVEIGPAGEVYRQVGLLPARSHSGPARLPLSHCLHMSHITQIVLNFTCVT